jgi:aspartate carbamoyltransferase catalytic subunit
MPRTQEGVRVPQGFTWTRKDVLDLDDFSRDEIDHVMRTTDAMKDVMAREIKRVPALRGVTIATLFYEASTRTRASFELAGKMLGADVINVSASGSSVEKGESLIDTVRTLEAMGVDIVVMRHGSSGAPYLAARWLSGAVLNGGDGWHAHPTQALLDLYTIRDRYLSLHGLKVAIVGDVLHSRVARSNAWGLTAAGANVWFCGPPTMLPQWSSAEELLPPVRLTTRLEEGLDQADVVMVLRLQKERQTAGLLPSIREYVNLYQVNQQRLALAKPGALLMHPGPMNEGVEISPAVAHGLQSSIEEQVTNGVAVRMALLHLVARRTRQ